MNRRLCQRFLALALLAASASCRKNDPAETAPVAPAKPEEPPEGGEGKGPSDLDRPVEELVRLACEHGKKAYQCDECRYAVGFVRLPDSILEGKLVTVARAERRSVATSIQLTGEVRFDERRVAHLSSQVEGIIRAVHVALGDRVSRGQPLLEIESVAVGEAQVAHLEAQGLLALARRNFERVSQLRTERIASEKEYLQIRQELEAAEIRAAGAQSKLGRLGSGGIEGGRIVLRAPLDGNVLMMHAVTGEVAKTGESLLTVGDRTVVWVWADLYERDIAAVQQGQAEARLPAAVSVKAYPGEEFPGVVDMVSPAMDEASRTVKVRVQVRNDDGRLLSGMFAAVRLSLPGGGEALAVPRAAVLEDRGRSFVFVHYQGEYYVRRPIRTGRAWDGWIEVSEGLEPNQVVVAEGSFLLKSDVLRSKMGAGCAD